uniref:Uncharacterized protein n=1 Tax=viral metagenome TaxID=1070528 RepID=A0A6M3LCE7_9ZZZZ
MSEITNNLELLQKYQMDLREARTQERKLEEAVDVAATTLKTLRAELSEAYQYTRRLIDDNTANLPGL